MYGLNNTGLGEPCVSGSGGDLVDCGSVTNLGQLNCWNPFATSYPSPGAPTTSGGVNPETPKASCLFGEAVNDDGTCSDWLIGGGLALAVVFVIFMVKR